MHWRPWLVRWTATDTWIWHVLQVRYVRYVDSWPWSNMRHCQTRSLWTKTYNQRIENHMQSEACQVLVSQDADSWKNTVGSNSLCHGLPGWSLQAGEGWKPSSCVALKKLTPDTGTVYMQKTDRQKDILKPQHIKEDQLMRLGFR